MTTVNIARHREGRFIDIGVSGVFAALHGGGTSIGVSREAAAIVQSVNAARTEYTQPASRTEWGLIEEFYLLKNAWRQKTIFRSSIKEITGCPEYKAIVNLGQPIIPLVLNEIKKVPGNWFFVLYDITGVNPVPEDEAGDTRAMRDRWLEWARQEGYRC